MVANPHASSAELAPPVPENLSGEQWLALWAEVTDACEDLLLAGLRREVGPGGDVRAAYRRWNAQHVQEHEKMLIHMLERLARCEAHHDR